MGQFKIKFKLSFNWKFKSMLFKSLVCSKEIHWNRWEIFGISSTLSNGQTFFSELN